MDGQERIQRIINHQQVDRVGVYESFWWETIQEWQMQGLPSAENFLEEMTLIEDYFDFDKPYPDNRIVWYCAIWPICDCTPAKSWF